jgi:hypothetical protein
MGLSFSDLGALSTTTVVHNLGGSSKVPEPQNNL